MPAVAVVITTAQRNDPENSGRWMRRGNQVVLQVADAHDRGRPRALVVPAIGMLVPFAVIVVMFPGGVVDRVWRRADETSNKQYSVPLASGLIAGEAIVAVIIPLLVAIGLVH